MAAKVSICIPTYNRREYLKKTLESVLAQTYQDYEIVIVDDGSTDGTEEMLTEAGFDVRYHRQENAGDAAARNRLIELAAGKYISFLDSDDLLPADAIERMVGAMNEAEDVIVYGPYVAIDEKGNLCRRRRKKLHSGYIAEHLFEHILVHSCGSMFPKKLLEAANGFDTSLPVCSDYDLWLRLSVKYRFTAITDPMFKRRRHSGNISSPSFENRRTEFEVLEKFYYDRAGKEILQRHRAMKRLSKEGYRAARAAIREGLSETASQLLIQSFHRHPNFKSLFWWLITAAKLHPKLRKFAEKQEKKPALRVAFDIHPALVTRYSGFYAVGAGLLGGFKELDERPEFSLFYSNNFSEEATLISRTMERWVRLRATVIKMRWLEFLWQWSSWPKLQNFTGDFDIYHSLHHLMPPSGPKPRILTVHDLRRYILPQLYRKSKLGLFELAVKRADHFIAVSASTKKDLCDIFGIEDEKIDVVHLAAGAEFRPVTETEKTRIKKRLSNELNTKLEKYLLVFSSPDRRKNVSRIVEAFLQAQKRLCCDVKLVVVGKPPKNDRLFMDIIRTKVGKDVVVTGPLDEVADLFRCADGLVFASLYEGFGIPVLEAFAGGVPVITSNCSSMPEVGGDAALYVDPYDIESIAEAMIKLCNDTDTRKRLVKAGLDRQKNFSWTKTAAKTLKVYQKVIAMKNPQGRGGG